MKPNNVLKQSETIKTKKTLIRNMGDMQERQRLRKIKWNLMGVSSESGLRYGFPCTAANYLVSLTTAEQIIVVVF